MNMIVGIAASSMPRRPPSAVESCWRTTASTVSTVGGAWVTTGSSARSGGCRAPGVRRGQPIRPATAIERPGEMPVIRRRPSQTSRITPEPSYSSASSAGTPPRGRSVTVRSVPCSLDPLAVRRLGDRQASAVGVRRPQVARVLVVGARPLADAPAQPTGDLTHAASLCRGWDSRRVRAEHCLEELREVGGDPAGLLPEDQVPGALVDRRSGRPGIAAAMAPGRRASRSSWSPQMSSVGAVTAPGRSAAWPSTRPWKPPARRAPGRGYRRGPGRRGTSAEPAGAAGTRRASRAPSSASTGSVSRSTSSANDGRLLQGAGSPTSTSPDTRSGRLTATCWAT